MVMRWERYPKDWRLISRRVREAAGWRCEGSPAFPDCRAANGDPHPETGSRVVLTVAHLDQDTTNNGRDNLRALCQRCHLNHDRAHHLAVQRANRQRRNDKGQGLIFGSFTRREAM